MANTKNDEMDRNRNTPQGSTSQGNMGQTRNTPQGNVGTGNVGTGSVGTGSDTFNRDREMEEDRDRLNETDRDRNVSGTDTSRNTGRGPSDISE